MSTLLSTSSAEQESVATGLHVLMSYGHLDSYHSHQNTSGMSNSGNATMGPGFLLPGQSELRGLNPEISFREWYTETFGDAVSLHVPWPMAN